MITILTITFFKEAIGICKGKFQIAQKNILVAMCVFLGISLGEATTPLILNIPYTKLMIFKILGMATVGFIASLSFGKIVDKFLASQKQDKPYQFTIKFRTLDICEFVDIQLKEQGIKTYINRNNKTLKAFSLNKEHSKIILDCIEGNFKNYSINEFKDYVKAPKINQNN